MCNYSAAGKEFRVSCKATETVGTLKQKICDEKGLSLSSVTLYCGPSLLTDSTTIVSDLLEFADSFLLELPEAGEIEIQSEAKEVFLLTGSSKKFEAPLRIKKMEKKIKIKARHEKFGIITQTGVDLYGTKSYQVERYQVKGVTSVTLKPSSTSDEVLVYAKGEVEPLVPVVMNYVEKVKARNLTLCIVNPTNSPEKV